MVIHSITETEVINMEKTKVFGVLATLMVLSCIASAQNASLAEARDKICGILEQFYNLILYIASGIAALVIVVMGVTWIASADNEKARTTAKVAIVHVIIGLIVISIAITLVNLALPAGSDCINNWTI